MDAGTIARMGLTLALLLGIPGLLLVALRRFGLKLPGQPDAGGRLGIVSRLAVDSKHSLVLLRRDGREQLILLGPTGPTILEAEVVLSPADKTAQRRRKRDEEARVAANRALLAASFRTVSRITSRARPTFHELLAAKLRGKRAA